LVSGGGSNGSHEVAAISEESLQFSGKGFFLSEETLHFSGKRVPLAHAVIFVIVMRASFAVVVAVALALSQQALATNVVDLTPETFDDIVDGSRPVFVEL
jgi:hypothetical protein